MMNYNTSLSTINGKHLMEEEFLQAFISLPEVLKSVSHG